MGDNVIGTYEYGRSLPINATKIAGYFDSLMKTKIDKGLSYLDIESCFSAGFYEHDSKLTSLAISFFDWHLPVWSQKEGHQNILKNKNSDHQNLDSGVHFPSLYFMDTKIIAIRMFYY